MKKTESTVRFLPVAEEDLLDAVLFVAADNPPAAEALANRFDSAFRSLAAQPRMGRVPDDADLRALGYRFTVVGNYLVFYVIEGAAVVVHRIVHGARDYKNLL